MIDNQGKYRALGLSDAARMLFDREQILIIFHINPDGDATGSAFALKCALESLGKRAFCVCAASVPERLQFIVGDSQNGVSIGDIPEGFKPDLVVSVDTASPSQMGNLYDEYKAQIDLMIDHHATGTVYADNYIDTAASATGEIMYLLAAYLVKIGKLERIPPRVLTCIYAAISSDTGGFKFSNTTPRTHMIAAKLIELGVDAAEINRKLFDSKSVAQIKAEGEAARRLKLFDGGRIAVTSMPYSAR